MAERHRWIKFWPQDWQRDPALRSCGVAARGLWIDLICLAHDAAQYGHILINGRAATMRQIGSISGIGEKEATKLISELEQAGVFSRTEDGIIFSRRMLRDAEASQTGREYIKRRWDNPTNPPNSPPNNEPSKSPTKQPATSPDSLEAEAESERKNPPNPPQAGGGRAGTTSKRNGPLKVVRVNGAEPRETPNEANGFNGWEGEREIVGGYYWDDVWPWTLEAAAMVAAGDDRPVRQWLRDGIEPDKFLPVIRQIAERIDYQPPRSLAYFDRPVRSAVRVMA